MKKLLAILILAGSAVSAVAAPTVLSIKESITDDAIVYPYSFETDTEALRNNWYLKNFAVLDTDVQLKNDVPTSKEDYIATASAPDNHRDALQRRRALLHQYVHGEAPRARRANARLEHILYALLRASSRERGYAART